VFVEFLGWFEDGIDVFFTMEYLRLGDLERNIPEGGKLPEFEVQQITKHILDGLQIMHKQSYAH
jgi:serine/threonine protein kinase